MIYLRMYVLVFLYTVTDLLVQQRRPTDTLCEARRLIRLVRRNEERLMRRRDIVNPATKIIHLPDTYNNLDACTNQPISV